MPLGAGVYYPLSVSYKDHTQEIGRLRVYSLQTNGDDFADNQTAVEALIAALNAAVIAVLVDWSWGDLTIVDPITFPGSPSSQRENKLLVRYHDVSTLKKMTATIPCINLPALVFLSEAKDYVSLAAPSFMPTLVSAWGNAVVNPETGNLTEVDSLEFVGRRS
jgi:hypothetical protein